MTSDDGHAVLSLVHRARGEFLAGMAIIEEQVNDCLAIYFKPNNLSMFETQLLVHLTLAQRLDVAKRAAKDLGLYERHRALFVELQALREERNGFAHRIITVGIAHSLAEPNPNMELHIRLPDGNKRPVDEALASMASWTQRVSAAFRAIRVFRDDLAAAPPKEVWPDRA